METTKVMTIGECPFHEGEVYLFHKSDADCPAESSLWGTFNRSDEEGVHLEILTTDCAFFRYWRLLPSTYRYCRLATREEERYFFSEQVRAECLANRFRC